MASTLLLYSESVMTSSVDVEFTSGDGALSPGSTSGRDGDVDDVIFVEEPSRDRVERPSVEVQSAVPDAASTQHGVHLVAGSTAQPLWIKSRRTQADRTTSSSTPIGVQSPDSEPVRVKSDDQEFDGSMTLNYVALAVNVALLSGIVFVVAVFLAVVVSVVLHRRRQQTSCPRVVTATPNTSGSAAAVSRPRIKAAVSPGGAKHASAAVYPPSADKPRLFVSVSTVGGDPKEWFV